MINLIKLITVIVVANLFCPLATPSNDNLKKKIDAYLIQGETNGFSGAVLIAKKGEVIINKGYGLANRDEQIINTPNTVFSTGSVTKQFTATAILKLVELNKLKLC